MGAWGRGIFDDDTAMDFLNELTSAKDPVKVMKKTLEAARTAEYIEYDAGQGVLVTAAIADTILNGTQHATDLDELDTFAETHKNLDVSSLKALASAAVRRVLSEGSELRDLWAENANEYPSWRQNLEALATRLDA